MCQKLFSLIAGLIFFAAGAFHIVRAQMGWAIKVGESEISMMTSYCAFAACLALGIWGLCSCCGKCSCTKKEEQK